MWIVEYLSVVFFIIDVNDIKMISVRFIMIVFKYFLIPTINYEDMQCNIVIFEYNDIILISVDLQKSEVKIAK